MKYFLSAAAQDIFADPDALVKAEKKPRRVSINQSYVVAQPDEEEIVRLNELAASRPFCSTHKAKPYDTL